MQGSDGKDHNSETKTLVIPDATRNKSADHRTQTFESAEPCVEGKGDVNCVKVGSANPQSSNMSIAKKADENSKAEHEHLPDVERNLKIAQHEKQHEGDKSPSEESTASGVVSPSSCSVSSQESLRLKPAVEEGNKADSESKEKKEVDSAVPGQSHNAPFIPLVSSSNPNATKADSVLLIPKPATSTEGPIKPHATKAKNHTKRMTSRKRSNSVPSYPHSGTYPLPATSAIQASASSKGSRLRRGKWTVEEETYVARVIQDFNNGFLDAPAGTTLRTYLSDKLNCDPMRITKKFTGDSCIGKRVFHPAVRCATSAPMIDKAQSELEALERRWRRRLEMQKREAEKKQAASAAASNAAAAAVAASAPHLHDPTSALIRLNASALPGNRVVVTRTASWLDRANAILSKRRMASETPPKNSPESNEVKKEMKEVEKLIQEGPIIKKSSGLLLQKYSDPLFDDASNSKRKVSDDRNTAGSSKAASSLSPSTQPGLEKRLRKSQSVNNLDTAAAQLLPERNASSGSGDTDDVAFFMGFISSLREEAASGTGSHTAAGSDSSTK